MGLGFGSLRARRGQGGQSRAPQLVRQIVQESGTRNTRSWPRCGDDLPQGENLSLRKRRTSQEGLRWKRVRGLEGRCSQEKVVAN